MPPAPPLGERIDFVLHSTEGLRTVAATIDRQCDRGARPGSDKLSPDRWPSDHHAATVSLARTAVSAARS